MTRQSTSVSRWLPVVLVLGFVSETHAAPPSNDLCRDAIEIQLGQALRGTTKDARADYQVSDTACYDGPGGTTSNATGPDVVYSFTAPSTGSYSFRVNAFSTGNDLVLHLEDTCTRGNAPVFLPDCLGASNRATASSSEEVACTPLASGQEVFLVVDENAFSLGSDFTIEVTSCVLEGPSNDTVATADLVGCGGEGFIDPTSDVDFVSLGAFPTGSRVFALVDSAAAANPDVDLRVTTDQDTLEYDNDNNVAQFGESGPNVAGVILTGGAAYLRFNPQSSFSTGPYRYYSVVQPSIDLATLEDEPNDDLDDANVDDSNYFRGVLDSPAPSTDVDLYAFSAQAGELVFLSLDSNPLRDNSPIDAALALLDQDGNVLVEVNDEDFASSIVSGSNGLGSTTPASPSEGLVYRTLDTGIYYARVRIGTSAATPIGTGDYLLSVSKGCALRGGGFPATPTPTGTLSPTATPTVTGTITPIPVPSQPSSRSGNTVWIACLAVFLLLFSRRVRTS